MIETTSKVEESELGKKAKYDISYNPEKLFPISRRQNRMALGVNPDYLPFYGYDYWNHYEVSWLNDSGKPIAAVAEIAYDCRSLNIIESKSMKLYFNSFNNTKFSNAAVLEKIISDDISKRIGAEVYVKITPLSEVVGAKTYGNFEGICLDTLDIECTVYALTPSFLITGREDVCESLYTDLLRSNCPVTNQPDWGSIKIDYKGKKIDHAGLLKYIVSFRNHNEFMEQCIERIFSDIMKYCKPTELSVYGRSTRRGGLDINPFRSTHAVSIYKDNCRLYRQ